ncbi:hypothetical protein GCM10007972_08570 [Iodidimonas muriae]|uniref:Uncharacterized protein n=1 Tax=Iodidimonas muriae TaxID=261467 RepID=A0ABQ2LCF0_9PROT|nr:hypothetical protein JCM17843_04350 [Kordiimonadales bacterium JCM 17843]GGO08311.1 hypothetical protein GCM10007972_08570 [Iodidimonas muriae]
MPSPSDNQEGKAAKRRAKGPVWSFCGSCVSGFCFTPAPGIALLDAEEFGL